MQVTCGNCQLSFDAPEGASGLVCPICRGPLLPKSGDGAGPATKGPMDWSGGDLDDLIAMLSAPALSARVEVLGPSGDAAIGEVHLLAGGVSDALYAGKSTDDALDKLRAAKPTRFRVEQRLPNPTDGDLTYPGPDSGTLETRTLAHLMRYCEDYVITCAIEVWRGNENARVEYKRGETGQRDRGWHRRARAPRRGDASGRRATTASSSSRSSCRPWRPSGRRPPPRPPRRSPSPRPRRRRRPPGSRAPPRPSSACPRPRSSRPAPPPRPPRPQPRRAPPGTTTPTSPATPAASPPARQRRAAAGRRARQDDAPGRRREPGARAGRAPVDLQRHQDHLRRSDARFGRQLHAGDAAEPGLGPRRCRARGGRVRSRRRRSREDRRAQGGGARPRGLDRSGRPPMIPLPRTRVTTPGRPPELPSGRLRPCPPQSRLRHPPPPPRAARPRGYAPPRKRRRSGPTSVSVSRSASR